MLRLDRRWLAIGGRCVAVLALSGCVAGPAAAPNQASSGTVTPVSGGKLTFGLDAESPGWVPGGPSVSYSGGFLEEALYDPLGRINNSTGQLEPFLAESIQPDPTFMQWTVKLRPGVQFQSGDPLTAQSLKDDFDQYLNVSGSSLQASLAGVDHVDVLDTLTAVYALKSANAAFGSVLGPLQPFNPNLKPKYGDDYLAHPDGTGAFSMASWDRNNVTVLKKNPNYWRKDSAGKQLPYLDEVDFRPIPNDDTRLSSVISGQLDGMFTLDVATINHAGAASGINTDVFTSNAGTGFFFNSMRAPVDDSRVRLAVAYATNKDAILAAAGGGKALQEARSQYYKMGSPFYSEKVASSSPQFDLAKAKDTLNQYVNDPKRSDGQAAGTPVTIDIAYVSGVPVELAESQVAQAQWQQAGFNVTLTPKQKATQVSDATQGNFTTNLWEWADQVPYGLFQHNYLAYPANLANYAHYNNEVVINDISTLATTSDTAKIASLAEDIGLQFDKDSPVIFLGNSPEGMIRSPKAQNLALSNYTSIGWIDFASVSMSK
jgi:peptide/nickel transport system substrate-binding protein